MHYLTKWASVADKHIVAAGAVITRDNNGQREFLVIHRGYREDWSFPKGKPDPGEHILETAIREVREETGFSVELGVRLPSTHYMKNNATKDVHYWHARITDGEFTPNNEVDEVVWLNFEQANKILTYERDQEVLAAANDAKLTSPFIVMRHTQATKRAEWAVMNDALAADDTSRPLTAVGRIQAIGLVPALAAFGINQLHSSSSIRCRDTLGPYSSARGISIHLEPTLSEERHQSDAAAAQARVSEIARVTSPVALCTHRPVMPTVMEVLAELFVVPEVSKKPFDPALTPGSLVIYHRNALNLNEIVAVERHIH